jgi:putative metallohydrolase (TIGR04338 family)
MTDFQRGSVYNAEIFVRLTLDGLAKQETRTVDFYRSTLVIPDERKFGDIAGVQRYVDAVLDLNWVRATWPQDAIRRINVRPRRGNAFAHYERLGSVLAVPPHKQGISWAMREIVILHEVAHHLAPYGEHHGPAFAGILLRLVTEIIGPEVGLLLTDSYAMHEVKVSRNQVLENA